MYNISEFILANEGLKRLADINFEVVYGTIMELMKMQMIKKRS